MSTDPAETTGRLDDEQEEQEVSSTTDGPAAEGEYDAAQGSPGTAHPTGSELSPEAPKTEGP